MAFFPGVMPGMQVLWQPVVIQQIQNETIQQLRRQNNMLKSQLQAVLRVDSSFSQTNQGPSMGVNPDIRTVATDRFSYGPTQTANNSKRSSENAYYSPRMFQNHQRIYSTHSPRFKDCLSPDQPFYQLPTKQSTIVNETQIKRMVISKGKDGKYFRDRAQQNQYPQTNFIKQSAFCRVNTAETTVNTPVKSPLKRSHFPNVEDFGPIESKLGIKRLKSPSFLKERGKSKSKGQNHVKFMKCLEAGDCGWNDSCFKRTPPTNQNSQTQNKSSQSPRVVNPRQSSHRQTAKIPTIDLSVQCDSELSIERMVRQYRKQKSKSKKCDTFLYQIQRQLDGMYGAKNQ